MQHALVLLTHCIVANLMDVHVIDGTYIYIHTHWTTSNILTTFVGSRVGDWLLPPVLAPGQARSTPAMM